MHILEIVGQESPDGARIDQIRMILAFCHSQTDKMSSGSAEKAKAQKGFAEKGNGLKQFEVACEHFFALVCACVYFYFLHCARVAPES